MLKANLFIVAQLPFADFRPLIEGQRGRLTAPDWTSDNLDSGFVRGFGKISARNSSNLGLGGERSFADMNNAVRFVGHVELRQVEWNSFLRIIPWFRRLYFDGEMAGRFEFGFLVDENYEDKIFSERPVDTSLLAQEILSASVRVNSVDGSQEVVKFAHSAKALGHAYVTATTSNSALTKYPVTETFGTHVCVGTPMLHIRVSSGRAIEINRDRRVLNSGAEPEFFITSARASDTRNNVIVQGSKYKAREESASERVTRVLFAHLNSLLFAHSQFVRAEAAIGTLSKRKVLRTSIERMIRRFQQFQQTESSDTDAEFTNGMRLFGNAYSGRMDELATKLEALSEKWNQPTTIERAKGYFTGPRDLRVCPETSCRIA